jgi:GNAT superfamily N-acetyltransferase
MSPEGGGILIRPAGPGDRAFALATVMRLGAFGPPPWRTSDEIGEADARVVRAFFENPPEGAALLVAESGAAPLGFIYLEVLRDYFVGEEHGHIGILAVTEQAEGRGAGGALMRAAEAWGRERGYRRLTLNVFDGNTRARAVYDHLGYRPETIRYVKLL